VKSQVAVSVVFALMAVASGCDQSLDEYAPQMEKEFALAYIDSVRAGNLEAAKRYLHPDVDRTNLDRNIMGITGTFPSSRLVEVKTVGLGFEKRASDGAATAKFVFQYEFDDAWILADIDLESRGKGIVVKALNVRRLSESVENIHAFTLADKSREHYVFLGLAVAIAAFIIVAFIVCLRTPIKQLKWLWATFVLLGIGTVSFNWTAGQVTEYSLTVRLLGVRIVSEGPFSPWVVKVGFPLGAIVFLAKRRSLINRAEK
jgi:hypothetical protein